MNNIGKCGHCNGFFKYDLLHNGFNESAYAYCNRCGRLAILDGWKIPNGIQCKLHQSITEEIEQLLMPCECGGGFKNGSKPRCPHCYKELNAEEAAEWLEHNALGTKSGWQWQRNWTGVYALSIEDNYIKDNWKIK